MSTLNLPVIPEPVVEKEQELPVIKEVVEEPLTQDKMFKKKDVEEQVQINVEPVKKPKRKLSQKQIDHLAGMRQKRLDKAAAKKKDNIDKIPQTAVPVVKKQQVNSEAPPAPKMEKKGDGFYDFVNYMEKYKNLKKNWREREAEKVKARAPPPAPAPKPAARAPPVAPKPAPKVNIKQAGPNHRQVIAKKQNIPTVLSTGNKPGLYDSYF